MNNYIDGCKTLRSAAPDEAVPNDLVVSLRIASGVLEVYREMCGLAEHTGKTVKVMFNGSLLCAYPKDADSDVYHLWIKPVMVNKPQDPVMVVYQAPFHAELVIALASRALAQQAIKKLNEANTHDAINLAEYLRYTGDSHGLAMDQLYLDVMEMCKHRDVMDGTDKREWQSDAIPDSWIAREFPRSFMRFEYHLLNTSAEARISGNTSEQEK